MCVWIYDRAVCECMYVLCSCSRDGFVILPINQGTCQWHLQPSESPDLVQGWHPHG